MLESEAGEQLGCATSLARSLVNRALRYVRTHRFALMLIFLAAYLLFFSENNLVSILIARRRIAELEERCDYYREKITEDRARLEQLRTDNVNLEKYAREQFYMHREDEDVYVLEEGE